MKNLIFCNFIIYIAFVLPIRFVGVQSFSIYSPNIETRIRREANLTDTEYVTDVTEPVDDDYFTEVYPPTQLPYITIQQRINRCKELFPSYNYEMLKDSEQDELSRNSVLNPCRVDCVVYQKNPYTGEIEIPTYTRYFDDGKTSCYPGKVCTLRGTVGVCALDPYVYQNSVGLTILTSTQIPTTRTTTTPIPTTTKFTSAPATQPKTTTTTTTTTTTPAPTTTKSKPAVQCPYEGFFRDLSDPSCRKFYRCIEMNPNYLQRVNYADCQVGLVFDQERAVCVPEYLSSMSCPSLHTS